MRKSQKVILYHAYVPIAVQPARHFRAAAASLAFTAGRIVSEDLLAVPQGRLQVHRICMAPRRRRNLWQWASRVSALLGVRPTYQLLVSCRDDLIFCDPDVPGAKSEPLRMTVLIASPPLLADAARTMLSLANEVRDELRTLNATSSLGCDASSRRELLNEIAFNILRLAASPDSSKTSIWAEGPPADNIGLPPKNMSKGAIENCLEKIYGVLTLPPERRSPPAGGFFGGNAEAQYRIALYYFTGTASVCDGHRLWKPAIFWMIQSASENYAPADAWLCENGVFGGKVLQIKYISELESDD